jgi:hypothetical protein
MSEQSHGGADIVARLTAIEQRLSEIQAELQPVQPGDEVTVSAGPFGSTGDVQAFERALSEIPGVTEVTVRGYQGTDHAIFEVRLT